MGQYFVYAAGGPRTLTPTARLVTDTPSTQAASHPCSPSWSTFAKPTESYPRPAQDTQSFEGTTGLGDPRRRGLGERLVWTEPTPEKSIWVGQAEVLSFPMGRQTFEEDRREGGEETFLLPRNLLTRTLDDPYLLAVGGCDHVFRVGEHPVEAWAA